MTEDADWLGGKRDAQWLCDRLGSPANVELQLAKDFEGTPSSAMAYLRRGDRVLLMDFLRTIVGPSTKDIEDLAVEVQLRETSFAVMHPLLCLESRLANLEVIPGKRRGNGPDQAKWMIDITRAFLLNWVSTCQPPKQVAKAIKKIAELAEFKSAGRYCYLNFGLNALDAIPEEAVTYAGKGFSEQEWPRLRARIVGKQARWLTIDAQTKERMKASAESKALL